MSMTQRKKIDGFYIVLSVLAVALAALLIVTFRGIFTSVIFTYETSEDKASESRVNKENLDKAISKTLEKDYKRLNLGN